MRDDSEKWDAPDALADVHAGHEVALASVALTRQTLISGPGDLSHPDWPIVGWPDIAPVGPFALSLRRDRVLLIDGPDMAEGWHEETNRAVSDASDAYAVFNLSGARAFEVLQRGAEMRLDAGSRSVARLLFGLGVLLYRIDTENRFRIHVGSSHAEALIRHLKLAMSDVCTGGTTLEIRAIHDRTDE
jgi:hypothetical protein